VIQNKSLAQTAIFPVFKDIRNVVLRVNGLVLIKSIFTLVVVNGYQKQAHLVARVQFPQVVTVVAEPVVELPILPVQRAPPVSTTRTIAVIPIMAVLIVAVFVNATLPH
jgi:hypothetical protein